LTSLVKLRHRITPVIEYWINQMKRKITVSYFFFNLNNRIFDCVCTPYCVTSNIKRLRAMIRFGPHIAGAPKCESRTPEPLPCAKYLLRPRRAGSSHGAGPRADVLRGPRKRGALREGPARPPLRPALDDDDDARYLYPVQSY